MLSLILSLWVSSSYAGNAPFRTLKHAGNNATQSFDTLFVHPIYPPLVYAIGEYHYFKYTARHFPENLLQSFKILATCGNEHLTAFRERTEEQVIEHGMFASYCRMRKEFGLDGYCRFALFFHHRGIYYPYAMKTFILMSFHQYLNEERIQWQRNKRLSLKGRKQMNKVWKKRLKNMLKPAVLKDEPAEIVDPVFLDPIEEQFYSY